LSELAERRKRKAESKKRKARSLKKLLALIFLLSAQKTTPSVHAHAPFSKTKPLIA